MHQRHHDLPKAWLHAVDAFLIRIQKRLFLVTFCIAWGWPLVVGIFKKCKWYTSVDSGACCICSSFKGFAASLGTDQLWHDSVKCPFSKQTKQHVDTTTLSCLGQETCVKSALPMLHVVEQEAMTSPRRQRSQQIAVNTRELPQQEPFFCITLKKNLHHTSNRNLHFSMVFSTISTSSHPYLLPIPSIPSIPSIPILSTSEHGHGDGLLLSNVHHDAMVQAMGP